MGSIVVRPRGGFLARFARLLSPGFALTLAACGGGGGSGGSASTYGIDSRAALTPLAFPHDSAQSGDVALVKAYPNLTFSTPLFYTAVPGDNSRAFVTTQGGQVFVFANDAAVTTSKVFLDLTDRTHATCEEGLLGMAFDPDYAHTGYVYAYYVDLRGGDPGVSTISRFHVSSDPDVVDTSTEQVLFTTAQPYCNHKGGWIAFGPDGKLYIALGDGGSGGDPQGNGQNLGVPLGKMLRINSDGTIPADNPFVGTSGARGEIWAYGLRNPFRDSFDRATGDLWTGDVGQNSYEEVDRIVKGGNYGWSVREGLHGYPTADTPKPAGNTFIDPLIEYPHDNGRCSITGGYVYRGGAIAKLAGVYLYTDYCGGQLYGLTVNGTGVVSNVQLAQVPGNPLSFGEDAAGEVYVGSADGNIYKIVPNSGGGSTTFPQKLSQTGLFSDMATLKPNPGLIEYAPEAPFWSDGATKRRWIGVPNGGKIGFSDGTSATGAFGFPADTVTVKHFEITLADGSSKRLETRVFLNQSGGWQGYDYRWNDAGTDADLLSEGQTTTLTTASGTQTYEFPAPSACLGCHTAAAGYVLGVRADQLNGPYTYAGGVTDNQLRTLDHIGLFDRDIGSPAQYAALTVPTDPTQPLARRARAYLETNCAQCHRPGGPTPVDIDLRAATPIAATNLVGVAPTEGDLGLSNAQRIAAGTKESSVLWERMRRLDDNRMPPLASHVVDQDGVTLIGQWIDAGAKD